MIQRVNHRHTQSDPTTLLPALPAIACWAIFALAACGTNSSSAKADAAWVRDIVAADPLVGGGQAMVQRLESPFSPATGDPAARTAFFASQTAELDAEARARVAARADETLAREALSFFDSDAGRAFADAELFALAGYPHHADDFPRRAAETFGDPGAVGPAAAAELADARALIAEGHGERISPLILSLKIPASRITPEQAEAIAAFFASDAGQRWLELQVAVFSPVQDSYRALRDDAIERGFIARPDESELPDLVLPKAEAEKR